MVWVTRRYGIQGSRRQIEKHSSRTRQWRQEAARRMTAWSLNSERRGAVPVPMRPAQEKLLALVDRIFADGVVDASERSELVSLYRGAGLTVPEVREVFEAFLQKTWGDAIADAVFTDDEYRKLATIVRELHVPTDCVPPIVRFLVRGRAA